MVALPRTPETTFEFLGDSETSVDLNSGTALGSMRCAIGRGLRYPNLVCQDVSRSLSSPLMVLDNSPCGSWRLDSTFVRKDRDGLILPSSTPDTWLLEHPSRPANSETEIPC